METPPPQDTGRGVEFDFLKATENAALRAIKWLGRGDKERAEQDALDAVRGILDCADVQARGVAADPRELPRIEKFGCGRPGSPEMEIVMEAVDGVSNLARGAANSISVIAAVMKSETGHVFARLPCRYSRKIAYGPQVRRALEMEGARNFSQMRLEEVLGFTARALGKNVRDLIVLTLERPRHANLVNKVRMTGAAVRTITGGDIAAAIAPSIVGSGVDLYVGAGGSGEGLISATALKCLGGDMELKMWFPDKKSRAEAQAITGQADHIYRVNDLVAGDSALFFATGICDGVLLRGLTTEGHQAHTHSIMMQAKSGAVRHIHTVHELDRKGLRVQLGWDGATVSVHGSVQAHSHKPNY